MPTKLERPSRYCKKKRINSCKLSNKKFHLPSVESLSRYCRKEKINSCTLRNKELHLPSVESLADFQYSNNIAPTIIEIHILIDPKTKRQQIKHA